MTEQNIAYSFTEIQETIHSLQKIFDIVRLVDPVAGKEMESRDGKIYETEHNCFAVWEKNTPCRNCSSVCAFHGKGRCTKFEFMKSESFYIVSKFVIVDGMGMVLEMVSNVTDQLLLGSSDKSELVDQVSHYNRALYLDTVSGICNRSCFEKESELLYASTCKNGQTISAIMIDIDDFKAVNDVHGHLVGDVVIKEVAAVLQKKCRESSGDVLARYGGDEFVMMIADISKENVIARMRELLVEVKKISYEEKPLNISLSIGTVTKKADAGLTVEDLIQCADKALYQAKRDRKGQVMDYSETEDA